MCVVAVRIERGAIFIELVRIDLAVMVGERQHLVAGVCRDHAGILRCDGVDDGLIGLRATY